MSKKIIVTNGSELVRKYTAAGFKTIKDELKKLIAINQKSRELNVSVIYLDDPQSMKPYGSAVTQGASAKQNKAAIDSIFAKELPDYLMILGAPDVVPYQDLTNPVYDPASDVDTMALGDLPYASDKPYSRDISDFVGPTRVVGRLPDLTCAADGEGDVKYLIGVIRAAASFQTKDLSSDYFGLSAGVWKQSTELSLQAIFGNSDEMFVCPPHDDNYTAKQQGKLTQFVNCHGATVSPKFYGQDPNNTSSFPDAMDSSKLKGLAAGTVAAFECCYGAELYDPAAAQNVMSIANRYLEQRACGVCASTTIAYGPADSNAQADLLCRYFLQKVIGGASIGRAMLEAPSRIHSGSWHFVSGRSQNAGAVCIAG